MKRTHMLRARGGPRGAGMPRGFLWMIRPRRYWLKDVSMMSWITNYDGNILVNLCCLHLVTFPPLPVVEWKEIFPPLPWFFLAMGKGEVQAGSQKRSVCVTRACGGYGIGKRRGEEGNWFSFLRISPNLGPAARYHAEIKRWMGIRLFSWCWQSL